jgi:sec-independent protein translocase protein TatC
MSIIQHLEELRKRLVRACLAIAVGSAICWNYGDRIRDFLTAPLLRILPQGQQHLSALKVTDPFVIKLKLSFFAALLFTSPVLLYQIWAFVQPALHKKERVYVGVFTFFSVILFFAGVSFGYWVFLPLCFKFFVAFISGYLIQNYTLTDYVSFTVWALLSFGLIFQTPLVLLFLNLVGLVHAPFLKRFRKYAFLLAFVVGAILTPTPDMVNQTVMSLPIYLFYEISILVISLFGRKPPTEELSG